MSCTLLVLHILNCVYSYMNLNIFVAKNVAIIKRKQNCGATKTKTFCS
jgi:hypothetical protein